MGIWDTGGALRHYIYIAGAYYFFMTTTLLSLQVIQQRANPLRSDLTTRLVNSNEINQFENPNTKMSPDRVNDIYFDIYAKQW